MNAWIKRSLYIGDKKKRFDIFDKVNLMLKSGKNVKGKIISLGEIVVILEGTDGTINQIFLDEIEDYLAE